MNVLAKEREREKSQFGDLHTVKTVDFMQNADFLRVQEREYPPSLGALAPPASQQWSKS